MKLFHRLDGDPAGPVLVLASSLGTTHELWDRQLSALAAEHRVLRYDHPGHGASPPGPRTIEGLALAVLSLLDDLGAERFTFCGVSLGGMVGIWLAANARDRVERLVLGCTAPQLPPPNFWQTRADTVREGGVQAVADAVSARWFTDRFRSEQPEAVRRYRGMLAETPAEGYARCCEAIRDMDLRAELASITVPTTVILGAHDPVVPEDGKRALAQIAADVIELDAAHLANVEQPSAFTAAVLR